jgi:hypothetical protein
VSAGDVVERRTGLAQRLGALTRPGAIPRPLALALLFLAGAAFSAVTILKGIQQNDEGLMLQAAARIASGEVPYSDFWWYYPPGQPYLLAGLWEVFGPSLVPWRVLRVLTDASVGVLVYLLARRYAPPGLALAAWLAAIGAMASPSGPHPYPVALAFALGGLLLCTRHPVAAGVLTGLCAVWRIEFAAYLGVGIVCAYAVQPGGGRGGLIVRYVAVSLASALALFAPVVLAAGLGDSWDLLVRYPIEDFSDYQSLPFPISYEGDLSVGSLRAARDSAASLLIFYLPLVLLVGSAAAVLGLALRFRRDLWPQVAAVVFSAGMAHYLLVRVDQFHTGPLAVMFSVLAAWALAGRRPGSLAIRRLGFAAAGVTAVVLAWVAVQGVERAVREVEVDSVAIDIPVADGVTELPRGRCSLPGEEPIRFCTLPELEQAVAYVRAHVPPGRPIYVATRRSDLITSGSPLFYVLAERPNPTHYDIQAPGVITSAPVQREITRDLERNGLPTVVRWTAPITAAPEPNRAGESTGVHVLDDFLEARYRQAARFGSYQILERRG